MIGLGKIRLLSHSAIMPYDSKTLITEGEAEAVRLMLRLSGICLLLIGSILQASDKSFPE